MRLPNLTRLILRGDSCKWKVVLVLRFDSEEFAPDCLKGNNSASVVADAILKGVTPAEDVATLYEAMLAGRDKVHPSVSVPGTEIVRFVR